MRSAEGKAPHRAKGQQLAGELAVVRGGLSRGLNGTSRLGVHHPPSTTVKALSAADRFTFRWSISSTRQLVRIQSGSSKSSGERANAYREAKAETRKKTWAHRCSRILLRLAAPPRAALADTLSGKVVKITDGDTLYILDANYQRHKIRLAGIDAPERKQAYGLASRKHLASIVAGQQVRVEYQKRDRYSGIVGKVRVNGVDVCLEQVKVGFAWHYKKYQHEQSLEDQRLYAEAEIRARDERLGLWRENNPNPPWEHRRFYESQ